MFIGMEHLILSNLNLADEALNAAHTMCDGDPLLSNERGVMAFNRGNYEEAAVMFQDAIQLAQVTQTSEIEWAPTYVNLGTCYRKLGLVSVLYPSIPSVLTHYHDLQET